MSFGQNLPSNAGYHKTSGSHRTGMDVVFAIRGLLSFVAFTEFTNAVRCFFPFYDLKTESHVYATLFSGNLSLNQETQRTLSHTYGLFSTLIGLIIIHTAIFAHYRPLSSLACCSQVLKLFFLITEAFIFGSVATGGQHLIFPLVTASVSIAATILLLWLTSSSLDGCKDSEENGEILKKSRRLKKNK